MASKKKATPKKKAAKKKVAKKAPPRVAKEPEAEPSPEPEKKAKPDTRVAANKKSGKKASASKRVAPAGDGIFGAGLYQFLGELGLNNERDWFEANKERYEGEVREPALEFIRTMRPKIARISKQFVVADKKVGGSLMRIYRDVRFSKNKDPYKTNVGIQFRHVAGKDVHAPGFYIHVEVDSVFLGAGMWHPDAEVLKMVREAIVEDPAAWKKSIGAKKFKEHWELSGESLKRAPKGFDPEHPQIEDLRRKDFIAMCRLEPDDVLSAGFPDLVHERLAATKKFMAWQAAAIGVEF